MKLLILCMLTLYFVSIDSKGCELIQKTCIGEKTKNNFPPMAQIDFGQLDPDCRGDLCRAVNPDPECRGDICKAGKGAINETNRLIQNAARELGKTPEAIQECFGNVPRCVNEIISSPLAIWVQAYIDGLYRQAEGKVMPFSPEFIQLAQPYYDIDLKSVTWADNIDTGHQMTLAFCDRIFFTNNGNLWIDKKELHLVLHEIEHLVQCQKRGKRTFLAEYVLKAAADVVKTRRMNVHDVHDFEESAEAKANQLTDVLWQKIQSGTVSKPYPKTAMVCAQGEVYMPALGGSCCTPNYSRCRNLTTGVVTCGMYGC